MGILLDLVEEVERHYRDGLDWKTYLRKTIEEYKKTHHLTDQSIGNEQKQRFNTSISENQTLDNGIIYNLQTGKVEKDI